MKKSLQIFAAALLLAGINSAAWAQNRYYWQGGSGNWSDGSKWIKQSGDATTPLSALPATPTANDDVFFDASAGFTAATTGKDGTPASNTVTIDGLVQAACRNMNWTGAPASPVLQINSPLSIGGSLTLISGMTVNGGTGGSLVFTATGNAAITSAAVIFNVPVIFNSTGGRWTLLDHMTVGTSAQFVSGHVVALPLSSTNPLDPDGAFPPTETGTAVSSPMFRFTTFATVSGASDLSHVIGYVQKLQVDKTTLPMPQSFIFPTGDGSIYRPITMQDPSSSTGDFTARYLSANPYLPVPAVWKTLTINPPLNSVSDKEFWYFTGSGSANTRFSFKYSHPDAQVRDYYRIDRWTGISIGGLSVSNSGITLHGMTWAVRPPAPPLQLPFLPLAARAVQWPGSP